ncbi:unnamed protein product [Mytilus edulis]|uniref:Uncharacterized protein n=1 Tax=Mytilus edulis TaxID=6550 RepID=A0A8S3T872_MYTED|nr:unnamed protein product [Mytilus edulis]
MDYENEQAFLSVKLYHYLSDVVDGSEKVVKYRRYVYKCFDDTLYEGNLRRISSGSKAEGPAISTALKGIVDIDYVRCFPCRKWPSIAKRWLSRNRCGRWPPSDLITEAIHEGVLLVPVGRTPIVFIRYLTFLYFHKQNNTEGIHRALQLLQEAVEKSPRLNGLSIFINFDLLLRAQSLFGDYEIETIKRMFSCLKDFDVTGLYSGVQSALEKECKLDFNE